MGLDDWLRQLDEQEARYREWVAPINQAFCELFRAHPDGIRARLARAAYSSSLFLFAQAYLDL